MPTFPIHGKCAPTKDAGFTLIELLVVLSIMGLLIAVAAPAISRPPGAVTRGRALGNLAAAFEQARHDAVVSGVPVDVKLAAIDPDLALDGPGGASEAVRVYPDGSSTPGTVTLDGKPLGAINWLTGSIDAAR